MTNSKRPPLRRLVAQGAALPECEPDASLADCLPGIALYTAWRGCLGELRNKGLNLTAAHSFGLRGRSYRRGNGRRGSRFCKARKDFLGATARLTRHRDCFWRGRGLVAWDGARLSLVGGWPGLRPLSRIGGMLEFFVALAAAARSRLGLLLEVLRLI